MKKIKQQLRTYMVVLPLSACTILVALPSGADAQMAITSVITGVIKRVIKAVDLQVQRLQNQTIWLQNAQKVVENTLSKLKLNEISDWTERQRALYAGYYEELVKVKSLLATYQRIRDMTQTQAALVKEYQWAFGLFKADQHFTAGELSHMEEVYRGILEASVKHLDELLVVVNSFKTQMTDAQRLVLINAAAEAMDGNYNDLRRFNRENIALSIRRAGSLEEVQTLKRVYAIDE